LTPLRDIDLGDFRMKTILMLGFSLHGAVEYAIERGWRINRARMSFSTSDLLVHVLPPSATPDWLRGLVVDEIIYGPLPVDELVTRYAMSRMLRRVDAA
jgi:hypothetical protein